NSKSGSRPRFGATASSTFSITKSSHIISCFVLYISLLVNSLSISSFLSSVILSLLFTSYGVGGVVFTLIEGLLVNSVGRCGVLLSGSVGCGLSYYVAGGLVGRIGYISIEAG